MILPLLAAALLAPPSAGPDPCAPVAAGAADRASAAAYQAVGDEERAAGRSDSATLAYRAALAADPSLPGARAGLAALCAARTGQDAFARGLERVKAGDCRGALAALDEARAVGDPAASLLAGVCRYRLGEDEAAAVALHEAQAAPDTRASAELYLGLLALRGGRPGEASPLFRSATADPALAPVARELARDAAAEGRAVLSLLGEVGWDSNVDLAPGGAVAPPGSGDALAGVTALLTLAPWLYRGPYVRGAATFQEQAQAHDFDLRSLSAAAGLPLGSARRRLLLEYSYDDRQVGHAPYLTAHRLLAEGRWAFGPTWTGGASYALRDETYHAPEDADDSGLRHGAQVDLTATVRGLRLTGAWQGTLDLARVDYRAYSEQGPLLAFSAPFSPRARLLVELAYTWRAYRATDPDFEVRREDSYLDGALRLELDLGDRWTAYLAAAGRRAFSNVPDLNYARIVPTAGISFTAGVL